MKFSIEMLGAGDTIQQSCITINSVENAAKQIDKTLDVSNLSLRDNGGSVVAIKKDGKWSLLKDIKE